MNTDLLLLPGMMCDARLFGPQIKALSGVREVKVGDIAGASSIAALADQVLKNAPQSFALAGLSMGGIVAMEIMARAPGRVERLALLDTNPRAELPRMRARRGPQMDAVRNGELARVMREELKPNYLADGAGRADILDLCMAMALDLGGDVFLRQSLALRDRADRRATLAGVEVPTLILCGRGDALCPVERHEEMHALVHGSRLVIVDGAGHLPTLERPAETNAALAEWLAA